MQEKIDKYQSIGLLFQDLLKDFIVGIINENNELDDLTLYALGLLSQEEIDEIIKLHPDKKVEDVK